MKTAIMLLLACFSGSALATGSGSEPKKSEPREPTNTAPGDGDGTSVDIEVNGPSAKVTIRAPSCSLDPSGT